MGALLDQSQLFFYFSQTSWLVQALPIIWDCAVLFLWQGQSKENMLWNIKKHNLIFFPCEYPPRRNVGCQKAGCADKWNVVPSSPRSWSQSFDRRTHVCAWRVSIGGQSSSPSSNILSSLSLDITEMLSWTFDRGTSVSAWRHIVIIIILIILTIIIGIVTITKRCMLQRLLFLKILRPHG